MTTTKPFAWIGSPQRIFIFYICYYDLFMGHVVSMSHCSQNRFLEVCCNTPVMGVPFSPASSHLCNHGNQVITALTTNRW